MVRGFFFGAGAAAYWSAASSAWALVLPPGAQHPRILEEYRVLCAECYPALAWHVMRTHDGGHALAPHQTAKLARDYCDTMYVDGSKVVPPAILAAAPEVREAFLTGLCDATRPSGAVIDLDSQLSAAHVFVLATSLGYAVTLSFLDNKYRVTLEAPGAHEAAARGTIDALVTLEATCDYVYDATTCNHHFAAGVGRLVVHNTDSVFVRLDLGEASRRDVRAHFQAASDLAERITAAFRADRPRPDDPRELEMEKCYQPWLSFGKKRYAGMVYTRPEPPARLDVKGLQLVRRDSPPLVRDLSRSMLDAILVEESPERAVQLARDCVLAVLRGEMPVDRFVVSKALRGNYKNKEQPHLHVAHKIARRTGERLPSGMRVPYVFVRDAEKADALQAYRAEDPAWAAQHGLPLDRVYYVDNQLRTPITSLLAPVVTDAEAAVFGHDSVAGLLAEAREAVDDEVRVAKRRHKNQAARQPEITAFFTFL